MEMYKEPYTENFNIGGFFKNPIGEIGGAAASGITALVEPILKTFLSVFGKIFGKWWVTVQYFFLFLAFVGFLAFILIMVLRLQLQASLSAGAMAAVSSGLK